MQTINGRILKSLGGFYHVETPAGLYICKARGVFRLHSISPCAGDFATVTLQDNHEPLLSDIAERKNALIRPPLANLDMVVIVVSSTAPVPNTYILDKLIMILESKEIEPILVCSKPDLKSCEKLFALYTKSGFSVFTVNNISGEGVPKLLEKIRGKTTAFIGNSGVGKTSLLNHIFPDLQLVTAETSKKLGRGRHTTRQVALYPFAGGYIADTPGFSTVDAMRYADFSSAEIRQYFREFKTLQPCAYADCSHTKEEGCSVILAAEEDRIAKSRLLNYQRIYSEVKTAENTYP